METGNINTWINGHVACLKLLINQSRLRSCHYEWVIITSDNLKRVDPLCWEHFELFPHFIDSKISKQKRSPWLLCNVIICGEVLSDPLFECYSHSKYFCLSPIFIFNCYLFLVFQIKMGIIIKLWPTAFWMKSQTNKITQLDGKLQIVKSQVDDFYYYYSDTFGCDDNKFAVFSLLLHCYYGCGLYSDLCWVHEISTVYNDAI